MTLTSLLWADMALAICPADHIENAIRIRTNRQGLDAIVSPLVTLLPETINIPEETVVLSSCIDDPWDWFDDNALTPSNGVVNLDLRSLTVTPTPGHLVLEGTISTYGGADLDLEVCFLPNANACPGVFSVSEIDILAVVAPSIQGCGTDFEIVDFQLLYDDNDIFLDISDCGLYDEMWELAYDWFTGYILDKVETTIIETVYDIVPPLVESFTNGFFATQSQAFGLTMDVVASGLSIDSTGVSVDFQGKVVAQGEPRCVPADVVAAYDASGAAAQRLESYPPLPAIDMGTSTLAVAASEYFIANVVDEAWRAGWVCFDTRESELNLGQYLEAFSPGATLEATVYSSQPPSFDLLAGAVADLRVAQLQADVELQVPGYPPSPIYAQTDAQLSGHVFLDHRYQTLALGVDSVETGELSVHAPESRFTFLPENVESLLNNSVLPAFGESLSRLPLLGALMVSDGAAMTLDDVQVLSNGGDFVQASLSLWPFSPDDSTPPNTILGSPIAEIVAPEFEIEMASIDDQTPSRFMRHVITIDGETEALDDGGGPSTSDGDDDAPIEPRAGSFHLVSGLSAGLHQVAITAVDLNNNYDLTPLMREVLVDAQAPQIRITQSPKGLVDDDTAEIAFAISDDHSSASDIDVSYQFWRINPGANSEPTLLDSGTLGQGRRLLLDNLPEDSILSIEIIATDAVGNQGRAEASFAVNLDPTFGGCSATGGNVYALLLMLGALIGRRRRSHRLKHYS